MPKSEMNMDDHKHALAVQLAGMYHPVMIRGERLAIRRDRILGRAAMGEMMARDDLAAHIAGFITRRGRLIPVLDLHQALVGGSVPPVAITILIVRAHSRDNPGLPVGIWVDEVHDPVAVRAEDIRLHPGLTRGGDALPCLATVVHAPFALLDLDAMVGKSVFASG